MQRITWGRGMGGGVKCPFPGPHPQGFGFTIYGVDSAMCIFTKQPHVVLVHLAYRCPREMSIRKPHLHNASVPPPLPKRDLDHLERAQRRQTGVGENDAGLVGPRPAH